MRRGGAAPAAERPAFTATIGFRRPMSRASCRTPRVPEAFDIEQDDVVRVVRPVLNEIVSRHVGLVPD
jgi:hypothetical protein